MESQQQQVVPVAIGIPKHIIHPVGNVSHQISETGPYRGIVLI